MTHLTVKKWNFQKKSKVFNFLWYKVHSTQILQSQVKNCNQKLKTKKCVSFSYPKDHSTQKLGSQVKRCVLQPADRQTDRQTFTSVIYGEKSKNVIKKRKNENSKKTFVFTHVPIITQPKNQVPRSKGVLCSSRTDRHTDTKVNTEDTLSGFQDFFLQPIIKDRPNTLVL